MTFEPSYPPTKTNLFSCCAVRAFRYLAAKSEADHYNRELQREQDEIDTVPDVGKQTQPPATSSPSSLQTANAYVVRSSDHRLVRPVHFACN